MFTGCNCYLFVIFMVIKRVFVCDSVLAVLLNRFVSFSSSRGKEGLLLFTSFIFLMQLQSGQQARGGAGPSHPSQPLSQSIVAIRASLHIFSHHLQWRECGFSSLFLQKNQHQSVPCLQNTALSLLQFFFFFFFFILSFVSSLLISGFCLNIFTRCKK